MQVENILDIKVKNTRNIVDAIRFSPGVTKTDIMKRLNLSFATVSNICRELRDAGLVEEYKDQEAGAGVGRSPMLLNLRYDAFYIICLDLHRTGRVQVAVTTLRSEIIARKVRPCDASLDFLPFTEVLWETVTQCFEENGLRPEKAIGAAVAVPAIYDQQTGHTVSSLIPAIENQPLKSRLESLLRKPVYVDNETNAHAVAAMTYPESQDTQDIIYLLGSSGVGVGIVSGGRLVTGSRGHASEICHIPIGDRGIQCPLCGQYGCVESDLCTRGFLHKYAREKDGDTANWDDFTAAVHAGEPAALRVVAENGAILGELASILVNMFDPDILYIGGDIVDIFEALAPIAQAHIERRLVVCGQSHVRMLADRRPDALIQGCSEQIFGKLDLLRLA